MTVCNMSIEAGARAGMIAPDETTFDYLEGRPHAPKGADWDAARRRTGARCAPTTTRSSTTRSCIDATHPRAVRHVGHQPRPGRAAVRDRALARRLRRPGRHAPPPSARWSTWTCAPGTPMRDIAVDTVFIGSCTNGRIEDLRAAAAVLEGRQVADGVTMLVVPGSARVRLAAEAEGLDKVFAAAGAQWRNAGCSMCMGMNPDKLAAGQRSASTSQPQLRGPAGPGRAHAPRVAAGRRRHRRRSATSPRPPTCGLTRTVVGDTAMEKFTVHTGRALPLRRSNVDTDQIIPGEYLKRITRHGYEDALFADWRRSPTSSSTTRRTPASRCWWPGPSSAPARRASTRCGRCRTTASRSCCPRASPTSSAATPARSACSPQSSTRTSSRRCGRSSRPTRPPR